MALPPARPPGATGRLLPDGARDERASQTALAIAVGGVICPVPFVMPGAAIRIARGAQHGPRRRLARAAIWIARATIAAQAVGLIVAAVLLAT
jgi:hypothetical protein